MTRNQVDLIKQTQAGDRRALARLLTELERQGPALVAAHSALLEPPRTAFRLGLTGPPGAGKSTLISRLIGHWLKAGLNVGVMAVDPSSPLTEGAILGDRIRYQDHVLDPNVFIRSLGSRGSLGGLSSSAWLMVRAFDLAGFDVLILETVGVGQTELEIMNVADFTSVVLTPEAGDGVQGMKAGLIEIADVFAVNKADRPGADVFTRELEAALELDPRAMDPLLRPRVFQISALMGQGMDAYFKCLEEARLDRSRWSAHRKDPVRLKAEARAMLMIEAERRARQQAAQIETPEDLGRLLATVRR